MFTGHSPSMGDHGAEHEQPAPAHDRQPTPPHRAETHAASHGGTYLRHPSDLTAGLDGGRDKPNRFMRDPPALPPGEQRSQSTSPFRLSMPYITPGQLAFSALQFLPVPVLVLDSLKTVLLANEAMGRLLGLIAESAEETEGAPSVIDQLRGQSLAQVGIDLVQETGPVWVDWERFLDQIAAEMRTGKTTETASHSDLTEGESTPRADGVMDGVDGVDGGGDTSANVHPSPNAVIEVVISRGDIRRTAFDNRVRSKTATFQTHAKMIISVWEVADKQTYFTLTFTNTDSPPAPPPSKRKHVAGRDILEAAERKSTPSSSDPPSVASSHDSGSAPLRISPGAIVLSSSPFPPLGPPSNSSISSAPSILQKMTVMKDALLDNTQTPILAMWKDGSVLFPNRAARELFNQDLDFDKPIDGIDLLPAWTVWNEDFTRQLDPSEYPISVLTRTETPFTGRLIGMLNSAGKKMVFDVEGAAIRDDSTGEFLAGVVTCRDVTKMTEEIDQIRRADEERFKLICDTMPQLVWTATPDGSHDFFNGRWYNYTGLSEHESLGLGWKKPFHPDDMAETERRWKRSLATGEMYMTEYRCRSKDGEWRWFLGRALPLKNKQTGATEKWFGTYTDIHESIQAKLEARRTRQQLLSVIAHSHMTIFTVDLDRKITMLEGALIRDSNWANDDSQWYIGENVYEVFNRLNSQLPEGQTPPFLEPLEAILTGRQAEDLQEHEIEGRWYRTRFQPVVEKQHRIGRASDRAIEGVIGLIMDVTELKARERDIEAQAREKRQLLANEAAAKEASRLKSQFLANMSHEIRTPITGVMGMAELLLDLELSDEQREYAENIYRSGNALLTVINDILDFSKVESGRLDIEEVQFSLSVVVRDVSKMLSFAAERKNLDFQSDIAPDIENNLVVMGDPGRVRQIITNLLTNSIKFTNQGHVKFSVLKQKETSDTIEIKFVIDDTGIGIDDTVRERLFQPFSQGDASTARKFGGTGLGLTICKNLLDLMKGEITLESVVGAGTTATFWIPFHKPQGAAATDLVRIEPLPDRLQSEMSVSCNSSEFEQILGTGTPPTELTTPLDNARTARRQPSLSLSALGGLDEELPAVERANIHVLVVEDNAINQQIATKTIKKLGFQVTAAWNGKEALDYLDAAKNGVHQKPDIILMDVQMPVIDGYRCTHMLRHHLPYKAYVNDIPIVAMTASAIQGDREKCRKAGMDDYLAKPVKSKTLERMLVRWSTRKRLNVPSSGSHGSGVSDCSETSEQCDNADIPAIGLDDIATPMARDEEADGPILDDKRNLPTPRALARTSTIERASHFPGYTAPPPPRLPSTESVQAHRAEQSELEDADAADDADDEMMQPVHRIVTDELAQQSRDHKLMGAAGAGTGAAASAHLLTASPQPRSKRAALTEENVGRLEEEQSRSK